MGPAKPQVANVGLVKGWLLAQKELSYHYVRIGRLSEPLGETEEEEEGEEEHVEGEVYGG